MNDRRFIELLNLYVDGQLDPAEAAELEAEVFSNPGRRRTYDQYCRIQRACCLLGERERATAPGSTAFNRSLAAAERRMTAPRRPLWRVVTFHPAFGASLAAACVAVVFVSNVDPESGQVASVEPTQIAPVAPVVASVPSQPAATTPGRFEYQPVFTSVGTGVIRNAREAEIAANDREALEWMQRVDALPVASRVLADETFQSPATLHQDNRVFRSRQGLQGSAEFTAYQFQR